MTVSYDDAVREAKQLIDCLSPGNEIADLLQSLLAGPPEPSEEEVTQTISGTPSPSAQSLATARRVQALYRSRRA
jgi:hypothetical protein